MAIYIHNHLMLETDLLDLLKKCYGHSNDWSLTGGFRSRKDRGLNYTSQNPVFLVAYDEGIPIGFAGFKVNGSFIVSAGIRVHQDYQKKGIAAGLIKKRNDIYNLMSRPALLLINTTTMPTKLWKNKFERTGWIDDPKYSDLNENTKNAIPSEVYECHKQKYVNGLMVYPMCTNLNNKC